MRIGLAYRPLLALSGCFQWTPSCVSVSTLRQLLAACEASAVSEYRDCGQRGGASTSPATNWATWLIAAAAIAPGACNADTSSSQSTATPPSPFPGLAAPVTGDSGAGANGLVLTNHPLEYDPVTNEHTAKMTLARTAALELYNAGKYIQAETKFREAVAEAQLGFEPHDPHIASAKNNLAEFLRNTGRWNEAEALYKEALELLERNFGEKHWLFVAALHNLALSYEARGDLAAARAAMERVLSLRLSMFGPRHFLYADSLFALGHMLQAVPEQKAEGLRMMAEAVRLLEEAEKLQVSVVLYWLSEIAKAHSADGRPDLAAAALRRAVAHMASERGDEAAAASALNEQLTDALSAGGRPVEAAAAAQAALEARRQMFGESALVVAQSEIRVAQLQLLAAAYPRGSKESAPAAAQQQQPTEGPGPALRALQHAEAAARICAANVEECSRGGLLSMPPPDKLMRRLRAAHTLGSAAKLVATLAGIRDPAVTAVSASSSSPHLIPRNSSTSEAASSPPAAASTTQQSSVRAWSWWPFSGFKEAVTSTSPATPAEPPSPPQRAPQVPLPLPEPVAELALADHRLEQAAVALTGATQAAKDLLQAVGSGRRKLPQGVSADELAGLLVEAQLQLLDVLERLGMVLQARVAAGQGSAAVERGFTNVVERHRSVLEQQERVAAELLG